MHKLRPQLRKLLQAFFKQKSLNTLEIQASGIMAPAAAIRDLKAIGAIISCTRHNVTDLQGRTHKAVALYTLEGFTDGE